MVRLYVKTKNHNVSLKDIYFKRYFKENKLKEIVSGKERCDIL